MVHYDQKQRPEAEAEKEHERHEPRVGKMLRPQKETQQREYRPGRYEYQRHVAPPCQIERIG
jgi:hypothetical protein